MSELEKRFEWLGWRLNDEEMERILNEIASLVVDSHLDSNIYEKVYDYWTKSLIKEAKNENRKSTNTNAR